MYTYPKTYKVKSLAKQENILRKHFKHLPEVADQEAEYSSEGLFLIPKWQLIGSTYEEALTKAFDAIKSGRDFHNWREGKLGTHYLRETPRKISAFKDMPDMVVIPAQFGQEHAGKSVRSVRDGFKPNEIGLGAYEVAIMLLTHPERLQEYDDLWIDCPGDEYSYSAGGDSGFLSAPCFGFDDGELEFDTFGVALASEHYGSSSGFVPQAMLESRDLGSFDSSSALKLISEIEEELAKFSKVVGDMKAKYSV